jgi:hypothetical protein
VDNRLHVFCEECWDNHPPRSAMRGYQQRATAKVSVNGPDSCCRCGSPTHAPIWFKASPDRLSCKGVYGLTHKGTMAARP